LISLSICIFEITIRYYFINKNKPKKKYTNKNTKKIKIKHHFNGGGKKERMSTDQSDRKVVGA